MELTTLHTNRLLRQAPDNCLQLIEHALEPVEFHPFTVILEPGQEIEHVIFPESGVVSLVAPQINGEAPEIAGIGREGVVGCAAAIGSRETYARWLAQVPISALRCPATAFNEAFEKSPAFRQHVLCYMEALLCQTMQSVACNAMHPVAARIARWILMLHDRADSERLPLTQESLAEMLSVHRSSIVIANASLQQAGLIATSRGAVTITDRAGLEAAACSCYRLIRDRYERLLPGIFSR